jgi:hypothetical protein
MKTHITCRNAKTRLGPSSKLSGRVQLCFHNNSNTFCATFLLTGTDLTGNSETILVSCLQLLLHHRARPAWRRAAALAHDHSPKITGPTQNVQDHRNAQYLLASQRARHRRLHSNRPVRQRGAMADRATPQAAGRGHGQARAALAVADRVTVAAQAAGAVHPRPGAQRSYKFAFAVEQRQILTAEQIVIQQLTKNVKEDHLREIFGKYGPIKDLKLPMNPECRYSTLSSVSTFKLPYLTDYSY